MFEISDSFRDKIEKNPTNQFQKLERATQTPIICEKVLNYDIFHEAF